MKPNKRILYMLEDFSFIREMIRMMVHIDNKCNTILKFNHQIVVSTSGITTLAQEGATIPPIIENHHVGQETMFKSSFK